jgi:hypothetical protein
MFSNRTQGILRNSLPASIPMVRLEEFSTDNASVWPKKEWSDPDSSDPIPALGNEIPWSEEE